jgi:spore cortex biosynthesis protein YabQ
MTLFEQFSTMIAMVIMGIWFGVSLSTYSRFVRPKKKWNWIMIATDILFWIVQGLLVFYVLLYVNQGEIRVYIFFALLLGYAAYKALLQTLYEWFLELLIKIISYVFNICKQILNYILIQPTLGLLKVFYKLGKMVSRLLLTIILFLVTVIVVPLKWLVSGLVPKSWREIIGQWFKLLTNYFVIMKDFLLKWLKRLR